MQSKKLLTSLKDMDDESDFPALYRAADIASGTAQAAYLRSVGAHSALLLVGAIAGLLGPSSGFGAYVSAVAIIGATFVSVFIAFQRFEKRWYRARAVAESVKTSTWRFAMRAVPFEDASKLHDVKTSFVGILKKVLNEHSSLAADLQNVASSADQITESMCKIRAMPVAERLRVYKTKRISEQRTWYTDKARKNKAQARLWFSLFIGLQAVAIACAIGKIAIPSFAYWPVDILLVGAGLCFSWINVKRFSELTAAYTLTSHEIGLIEIESEQVQTDDQLSEFVQNSENAFSREHTQWIARKDEV